MDRTQLEKQLAQSSGRPTGSLGRIGRSMVTRPRVPASRSMRAVLTEDDTASQDAVFDDEMVAAMAKALGHPARVESCTCWRSVKRA